MSTSTVTHPHVVMAALLVRSAFSHGRIICNRRLPEYKGLLDTVKEPLIEVLHEVAALNGSRLVGDVQVGIEEGDTMSTRAVVMAIVGMVTMHIIKSTEFFVSKLGGAHNNPREVFAQFNNCETNIRESFKFIDVVVAVDRRWRVVSPTHVERLSSDVQSLFDRLTRKQRRELELRSDLPETMRNWVTAKRR